MVAKGGPLGAPMDGIAAVCAFDPSAPDFFTKYVVDRAEWTAKPCTEFAFTYFAHGLLLFTTILGLFQVARSPRIPADSIRAVIACRLFVVFSTAIVLFGYIVLGLFSPITLPPLLVAEYGIAAITWLVYAGVWILAIEKNTWPLQKCGSLAVAYNLAALSLLLLTYQRVLQFGYRDAHCFGVAFLVVCHFGNGLLQLFEVWKIRSLRGDPDFDPLFDENEEGGQLPAEADEGAGFFSSIFFCWVNRLIEKGYRGELKTVENLFRVPPSLRVEKIENDFFGNAPNEHVDGQEFSLFVGLLRSFGLSYFSLGILRFLADSLTFAGPILLHLLVTAIENKDPENMGFVYASLMLVCSFGAALFDFNYNFYLNKIALKVRCATLVAIYDKLLHTAEFQRSEIGAGVLLNHFTTDLDRIVAFVTSFHAFWSMPFILCIALYLLYREVGWAFLAGLLCAIVLVPVNKFIAGQIGKMSVKLMHYKDQRLKLGPLLPFLMILPASLQLVTELIRSIRAVKLSNWEPFFEARITEIREQELKYLKRRKYLDAVCVYLWASAPILIIICILVTYTMIMEETLTPAKVFTSLALVNLLILPLNAYPWVLNSLVEAFVSKRRLDRFFSLKTVLPNYIYSLTDSADQLLVLQDAHFHWTPDGHNVGPVSFTGTKGMIIGVGGGVANGKTTLLMGILGEAIAPQDEQTSVSGLPLQTTLKIRQTTIHEGFAYCGHDSWVQRSTIRENILCGTSMNPRFYKQVLDATALSRDLEKMPGGDQYVISDDGSTLSGGQRARLALARAIYHDNDVVLLDDPFASLDRKVGRYVWRHAIEGLLRNRGRLVVVATHDSEFLRQTDLLIRLDNSGRVNSVGPTSEVFRQQREFGEVGELSDLMDAEEPPPPPGPSSGSGLPRTGEASLVSESSLTSALALGENVEFVAEVAAERSESGTVRIDVYWAYLRAVGFGLAGAILFALLAMQTTKNLSDAWLSKWTQNSTGNRSEDFAEVFFSEPRPALPLVGEAKEQTRYYLTVFLVLAAANTVFTLLRSFLFAWGGVVAAKNLHESLLARVFTSTIAFWDCTPYGRIVNRLCSDVYLADDSLPFQLNIFLATSVNLAGALILSVVALPFLLIAVALLFLIYYFIQRYYRCTTVEVKRLTSTSLSPLYGHINDTVNGLVTIRAFRFMPRFMETLRRLLEDNLSAQYTNIAAGSWLSVRLQLLGVLMVSSIAFTAIIESKFFHVESGLIGLAITYALSLSGLINNLLNSFIETEKELVAVERISDYILNIPKEESNEEAENVDRFLYCRTISGSVQFASVSMRYAANLPLALSNVSFQVEAGQRVAIIGRTGAGKTSIFQALLRAHPIESGKIFVDQTIDLSSLDPRAVRSLFGVVSQTPFLFSGTIRENLAMGAEVSDEEMLNIVEQAGLSTWLSRAGGLDAEVVEAGANFSFGERQIVAICRLILARPRIVLIDEASAHLDDQTHVIMNNLIRSALPTSTVISIVHRVIGLEDFDLIIEMSNGVIVRQGDPELFDCPPRRVANFSGSSRR